MVKVHSKGIILEKTENDFESQAVLNPACVKIGDTVHMLYRAVDKGNRSTIGYCKIRNLNIIERNNIPVLVPENDYEKNGIEDPRITEIEGTYYVTYTAYDGKNALAAYATTDDFQTFKKHGVISPDISYETALRIFRKNKDPQGYVSLGEEYQEALGRDVKLWDKDVFFFPKKIDGKFVLLHRIMPGIQIMSVNNLNELTENFWIKYLENLSSNNLIEPEFWFETRKIGGGCPPIETEEGWLLIYHGVEDNIRGKVYHAGAALLDKNDPRKVIGRLPNPLFSPFENWEKDGDVSNVVFPTGAYLEGEDVIVFYGAADKRIAVKTMNLKNLLAELKNNPVKT